MFRQLLSSVSLLLIWYSYRITLTTRPPATPQSHVGNQGIMEYIRLLVSVVKFLHLVHLFVEIYICAWKGWVETPPPFIGEWCGQWGDNIYPSGTISTSTLVAALCCIIGAGIRLLCYRALGDLFTWEVAVQKSHRLITTGPYSYVRHPSYTGFGLVSLGIGLFMVSPNTFFAECFAHEHDVIAYWLRWGYVALMTVNATWLYLSRVPEEDRALKKAFGKEWDQWAKRTPYRFLPFIF